MSSRYIKRRRLKKYSIGDMRERITIHARVIAPPVFDSATFSETYDTGVTYWASVETPNLVGSKISSFGGIAMPDGTSHVFIVRYDATVTSENIIRWEGNAYKILGIIDPDKRKQYLEIPAQLLGEYSLSANT